MSPPVWPLQPGLAGRLGCQALHILRDTAAGVACPSAQICALTRIIER
jgi:hypothetical protein